MFPFVEGPRYEEYLVMAVRGSSMSSAYFQEKNFNQNDALGAGSTPLGGRGNDIAFA
jgi:hypothetical protein